MRRASRHILSLLVTLSYVFAYMGFGIHTCHDDGSRHFVWMMGDVSCEAIHHHSHGEDHDHHHDDHCCSTQVYVLTDAQDSVSGSAQIAAPEIPLPVFAEVPEILWESYGFEQASVLRSPPLKLLSSPSFLSVWRA